MMRNLLLPAGFLLLLAPLGSALLDPIPPPAPLPAWVPTDATAYGIGSGTLVDLGCGGGYVLDIALFDLSQTRGAGVWSTTFEYHEDARTMAADLANVAGLAADEGCRSLVHSPINIDGTFDPATGGCLGGNTPPDADLLCLTFASQDPITGIITYNVDDEEYWTNEPSNFFSGQVQIAFADVPVY
jgi:hypothetical protein